MSNLTPGPDHAEGVDPSIPPATLFDKTKKAFAGAGAAGLAAATPTFWSVYPDGFTLDEVGLVVGSFVAGAVVGFLAVFFPRNASWTAPKK